MIKLKKLLIQNFKGINSKLIIDLDSQSDSGINILSGPNGFGKTTIFDAIELCLTGKFGRVELFNDVQKKNADKNKPFYQNRLAEDVFIKLWIQKDDQSYIITKWYSEATSPNKIGAGRRNQPIDSDSFFLTYLSEDTAGFESTEQDILGDRIDNTNEQVNSLIYKDSRTELQSTYYLFNYLQQEDSIYFLRQKEDDKGKLLSFLFNIEDHESQRNDLHKLLNHLRDEENKLIELLKQIESESSEPSELEYNKLFKSEDYDFDKKKPFEKIGNIEAASEKFNNWKKVLAELVDFRKNFDPLEYEKLTRYQEVEKIITSSRVSLTALTLKNIDAEKVVKLQEEINLKLEWATRFESRKDKRKIQDKVFELYLEDETIRPNYNRLDKELDELENELTTFDKIISDLNEARQNCLLEFEKLKDHEHIDEKKCPLCDSTFPSIKALINQIDTKTIALKAFNKDKLDKKQDILRHIESIAELLKEAIETFREENSMLDSDVLSTLRDQVNHSKSIQKLLDRYPELDEESSADLYFSNAPRIEEELTKKLDEIKNFFRDQVLPKYKYDSAKMENTNLFEEYFQKSKDQFEQVKPESITAKSDYLANQFGNFNNQKANFLNARLGKLLKIKGKADEILDVVTKEIQEFNIEMIQKIKIPFYIYSGKILQSYQQGMGIFMDIHPTQKNNVRFKTGHESDHDIVYHLSSGQLAVVAIAFCLSLNKVYNTNRHFKFLAIDDPIQTMDDLNIHMFIELLRHEFKDFQMLISTHDDFTSRYMKYKFDKFGLKTDIKNVQKMVFEQQYD